MNLLVPTVELKARLSDMLNQIQRRGDRLIVLRRGKPVAAIVPMEDLHRLEALDAERAAARCARGRPSTTRRSSCVCSRP